MRLQDHVAEFKHDASFHFQNSDCIIKLIKNLLLSAILHTSSI